jgi:hypothetical protein
MGQTRDDTAPAAPAAPAPADTATPATPAADTATPATPATPAPSDVQIEADVGNKTKNLDNLIERMRARMQKDKEAFDKTLQAYRPSNSFLDLQFGMIIADYLKERNAEKMLEKLHNLASGDSGLSPEKVDKFVRSVENYLDDGKKRPVEARTESLRTPQGLGETPAATPATPATPAGGAPTPTPADTPTTADTATPTPTR